MGSEGRNGIVGYGSVGGKSDGDLLKILAEVRSGWSWCKSCAVRRVCAYSMSFHGMLLTTLVMV